MLYGYHRGPQYTLSIQSSKRQALLYTRNIFYWTVNYDVTVNRKDVRFMRNEFSRCPECEWRMGLRRGSELVERIVADKVRCGNSLTWLLECSGGLRAGFEFVYFRWASWSPVPRYWKFRGPSGSSRWQQCGEKDIRLTATKSFADRTPALLYALFSSHVSLPLSLILILILLLYSTPLLYSAGCMYSLSTSPRWYNVTDTL